MRDPYYCPYCNHRSTRRWNLDVHIKRKHGEYLVDRSSANNPPSYNNSAQIRHATVADSVADFHPTFLPQQTPLDVSPNFANPTYPPLDVSPNFANPMNRLTADGQIFGTGLSPETILKIQELKRLVNKYPQFHTIDADEIVKWAIYCS